MVEERTDNDVVNVHTSALFRIATVANSIGDRLAGFAAGLAILSLIALLLLVLAQILMGTLSGVFTAAASAMSVSWEYAGYLMGAAFMFGMPHTLRYGGHIRVNVLFDALSEQHQRLVDLVSSVLSASIMGVLALSLSTMAFRSLATNSLSTSSLTPLWIPQGALGLAAWLFTLQLLIRVIVLLAGQAAEIPREYVGAPPE